MPLIDIRLTMRTLARVKRAVEFMGRERKLCALRTYTKDFRIVRFYGKPGRFGMCAYTFANAFIVEFCDRITLCAVQHGVMTVRIGHGA
jgi:hypothetical protein